MALGPGAQRTFWFSCTPRITFNVLSSTEYFFCVFKQKIEKNIYSNNKFNFTQEKIDGFCISKKSSLVSFMVLSYLFSAHPFGWVICKLSCCKLLIRYKIVTFLSQTDLNKINFSIKTLFFFHLQYFCPIPPRFF